MANWSDPRPGLAPVGAATDVRGVAYDAGLRAYMLSVYNYMASAVLLTGIVAMGVFYSGAYTALIGSYERLQEQPEAKNTDIPFICLTDDPSLTSETWEVRLIEPAFERPHMDKSPVDQHATSVR